MLSRVAFARSVVVLRTAPVQAGVTSSGRRAGRASVSAVRIAFAGPLLDEAGAMNGSLLVIDFPDRAAALAWLAAAPFTRGGVYGRGEVCAFRTLWRLKAGFREA